MSPTLENESRAGNVRPVIALAVLLGLAACKPAIDEVAAPSSTAAKAGTDGGGNDKAGTLQFSDATVSGLEGTEVTVIVTRTGGDSGRVTVNYASSDVSASQGHDHEPSSGSLEWDNRDSTSRTIAIRLHEDQGPEGDETFTVALSDPMRASIGEPGSVTVTILDNDVVSGGPGTLQFSAPSYDVAEGDGTALITVTRAGGSQGIASVSYATSDAAAEGGRDFVPASGTLAWADGDTSPKTFEVTVVDDPLDEPNQATLLTLSDAAGATLATPSSVGLKIVDNDAPTPGAALAPIQPDTGPAGTEYPFPGEPIISGIDGFGGYTLYEPNPRPALAPLVILLRGGCVAEQYCNFTSSNKTLDAWRAHLVKKGSIVLFPHYQRADEPELEMQNIANAFHAAVAELQQPGRVRPDLARLGMTGHSRGSQMTVKVASHADELLLPRPKWLMSVEPGPTSTIDFSKLASIPPETKIVLVVGEQDNNAGEHVPGAKALAIWEALGHVPLANRDYIRVRSHHRGPWEMTPQAQASIVGLGLIPRYEIVRRNNGDLLADHFFPGSGDALDIFTLWKISQALVECTGLGASCQYALGDTPEQRYMGEWSDGLPVNELCVTDRSDESWEESCGFITTVSSAWAAPVADAPGPGGDGNGFEANAAGAYADGGDYAENLDGLDDSHDFLGFDARPAAPGAISGLEVRVDWWADTWIWDPVLVLQLSLDNGATWSEPRRTAPGDNGEVIAKVGGPADLWGLVVRPEDLANASVRVTAACDVTGFCGNRDWFLDRIAVRAYTAQP